MIINEEMNKKVYSAIREKFGYGSDGGKLVDYVMSLIIEVEHPRNDERAEFEAFAMEKLAEVVGKYKNYCDDEELYLTMSYIKNDDGERIMMNNNYWETVKRVSVVKEIE